MWHIIIWAVWLAASFGLAVFFPAHVQGTVILVFFAIIASCCVSLYKEYEEGGNEDE